LDEELSRAGLTNTRDLAAFLSASVVTFFAVGGASAGRSFSEDIFSAIWLVTSGWDNPGWDALLPCWWRGRQRMHAPIKQRTTMTIEVRQRMAAPSFSMPVTSGKAVTGEISHGHANG
jgi:hypothetical protein